MMSKLINNLGGIDEAKRYLKWMKENNLLMGSYQIENGRASFYDFTLRSEISEYGVRDDH